MAYGSSIRDRIPEKISDFHERRRSPLRNFLGTFGSEFSSRAMDATPLGQASRLPEALGGIGEGIAGGLRSAGRAVLPESVQEQFGINEPEIARHANQQAISRGRPPGQSSGGGIRETPQPPEPEPEISALARQSALGNPQPPAPEREVPEIESYLRYNLGDGWKEYNPEGSAGTERNPQTGLIARTGDESIENYVPRAPIGAAADFDAMSPAQRAAFPSQREELFDAQRQADLRRAEIERDDPYAEHRAKQEIGEKSAIRQYLAQQQIEDLIGRRREQDSTTGLNEIDAGEAFAAQRLQEQLEAGEITKEEYDEKTAENAAISTRQRESFAAARGLKLPTI